MLAAVFVIAGWIAGYFALRRNLQRNMKQIRLQLESELKSQRDSPAATWSGRLEAGERFSQITPTNISALGESLSAFIGQDVQIRAIKKGPISHALNNPWAREGCVLVQNSHKFEVSKSKPTLLAGR